MAQKRTCPKCGAEMPGDVMEGLCPKCMGRVVFGKGEAAGSQPEDKLAATIRVEPQPDVVVERAGMMIGRYKLLEQIGEGGFGLVYMAEQVEPVQRKVALKVIKAGMDTREVIARFEAERQALALMDHPNIARVLDAGTTQAGRPYFVMELVRGIPITDYCEQKRLPIHERLQLFMKVCQAVQHAHQKAIIHRDLKPNNVLVTLHDGEPVPKVIDFGIAKALGPKLTEKTLFTGFAHLLGTPAYMSPEQAELSGLDIDTRSDIYSLGVLLYELLTGVTPFEREALAKAALDEMRRMIRETEPPKPSTRLQTLGEKITEVAKQRSIEPAMLRRLVRGDLDWIVMKCLEKDRKRRYETANGLARDVQRHLDHEPVTAAAPSPAYRAKKYVLRHKTALTVAVSLLLLLVAGTIVSTWQAVRATRAERQAESEAAKSEHVSRFLKDMLNGVGPSAAKGRDTMMLREILDKTAARVGKDLTNRPEVEAELRNTLGQVYYALGAYDAAEAMHRQALLIRRGIFGKEHRDVAESLCNLAAVLWAEAGEGRRSEAEAVAREALAMRRKLLGVHLEVATSLDGLATALEGVGKDVEAETMAREALAIRRQLLGNEHADIAWSLDTLAWMLHKQGKFAEAGTLGREAVAMQRRLDDQHWNMAQYLDNLSFVLERQGKLVEAETVRREALALYRKLLGTDDHPEVAGVLHSLAILLTGQSKLAEAETICRQALAIRRRTLGTNDNHVAGSLRILGDLLRDQGKLAEAEVSYREAMALQQSLPSNKQWDLPGMLNNLAIVLELQGRQAEAEAMYREALAADKQAGYRAAEFGHAGNLNGVAWRLATSIDPRERDAQSAVEFAEKTVSLTGLTGRKDPSILDTLAAAYAEAGLFQKAVSAQQEAIRLLQAENQKGDYEVRLKLYSANMPYRDAGFGTAFVLARMIGNLLKEERFAEAEEVARRCLTLREKATPDDWRTFTTMSLLGGSLAGQKKYAEAERFLVSGYEGMKQREAQIPAAGKVRLKEALERLVQLYEGWAKPEPAAAWRQKLADFNNAASSPKPAVPTQP